METYSNTSEPRRADLIEPLVVAIIIAAIFSSRSLSDVMQIGAMNDDGVYAVLGKALAEGKGYFSLHLVGQPVQEKYPPGFPFILSLLWRLSPSVGGVQHLVSLLHPVVVGTTAGLLWWLGRVRLGASRALVCLFVLLPFLFDASIQYYTIPLSEPWLMLGWAAVLVLWEKTDSAPSAGKLFYVSAAGLIAALTILVRSQGVVLIPAVLISLAAQKFSRWDRVAAVSLMLLPLVVWHFYHAALVAEGPLSHLPDEVSYGAWAASGPLVAKSIVGGVISNIDTYLDLIGRYLTGVPMLGGVIAALLFCAMIVASIALVRRQPLLGVSTFCALGIVILWPFAQDRLLLPVMPFGGLAVAVWLGPIAARWSAKTGRASSYVAAIVLALVIMRQIDLRGESIDAFSSSRPPTSASPSYMLLVNSRFISHVSVWIRTNTRPSDRIMVDNHSGVYLYTGRTTTPASPVESRPQFSVFALPGRYLANRILTDSLNYVIVSALTHSLVAVPEFGIVRDVEAVRQACPGVLQGEQAILKVRMNRSCLAVLAR